MEDKTLIINITRLLLAMKTVCKAECHCSIELESDSTLTLRWSGRSSWVKDGIFGLKRCVTSATPLKVELQIAGDMIDEFLRSPKKHFSKEIK